MKISFHWLKQYLPLDIDASEAAALLTGTGLETESVEDFESVPGGLRGLVVGQVLEVAKHPDADRLRLTRVDIGSGELLHIVCGAPNVAEGQMVVVATEGATLYPLEGEPFKIKKGKIRGQVSEGMICAEDEIGLGTDHDGIMILGEKAHIGMPASEYFGMENDLVLEIGLTPNRTDAMSHFGVARDLAAAINRLNKTNHFKARLPEIKLSLVKNQGIKVKIENSERCLRYAGITIGNVKVGPSPEWLSRALRSIGLSPINNVVDVTNFVMHECGQPLHAFDAEKIAGGEIRVKTFPENTPFVTLDGKERKLSSDDLMIADCEKPLCIAGVFGGKESGVSENTTEIFLESALFAPVSVRKTARRHQLNTDASFRFERGTDPEMVMYALKRAAVLICEITGANISSSIEDSYPTELQPFEVRFRPERFRSLTGVSISDEDLESILADLDIEITARNGSELKLRVPRYRAEVTREADVIEEILRICGYDSVPLPDHLSASLSFKTGPDFEKYVNRISDLLVARGFLEMMSNSLIKSHHGPHFANEESIIPLLNPLSSDLGILRPSLLPGGLDAIRHNINHNSPDLKLFEFGRTYLRQEKGSIENPCLALWMTGSTLPESWKTKSSPADFFDLRGAVNAVLMNLGVSASESERWGHSSVADGLVLSAGNKNLVRLGMVSKEMLREFDIDQPVFYAEFEWESLINAAESQRVKFTEPGKFPSVRRDLSLLVDSGVEFSAMKETILKTNPKIVRSVGLFDVYEGKNLEPGKKSYAIDILLRDDQATMKDGQIQHLMERITLALEKEHGARMRV